MDNEKMDGLSMDVEAADREKLQAVFPQCFTDGRLDIDKLLNLCGEYISDDFEKYEFRWKGKTEALQLAGKRSTGTLRPCRSDSVNWGTTRNVYIEGDNLEVLKLLQTSYFRKVKMIYIDPPYNTGNDFVYADDFADPLARYKEVTAQTTKSNPETMGRFHTNWLNMMYPRLRLAANLLRDDGVIFISIDDNEVHNLRKICDEIFGEENHVTTIACVNKPSGRSDDRYFATAHESILVYRKSELLSIGGFEPEDNIIRRFTKTDKNGNKYREEDLRKRGSHDERADRPNLFYPFFYNTKTEEIIIGNNEDSTPDGFIRIVPMKAADVEGNWRWGKDTAIEKITYLHPRYMPNKEQWSVFEWEYLSDKDIVKPTTVWDFKDVNSERGTEAFVKHLGFEKTIFQNPKPIGTIARIVKLSTTDNDTILDFFSGSATTAQAVMQMNAEDGGNRRFILVQLPELTSNPEYPTICEIGKARVRKAGEKIKADSPLTTGELDVGFRVFKLDSSNLKLWDSSPIHGYGEDAEMELYQRLIDHLEILKPDRTNEDVVFEVMLKLGQDICETVTPLDINGKTVYGIGADVKFIVCLADDIQPEDAKAMADYAPGRIIFADSCFSTTEQKSNVRLTLKDKGITIKTL